VLAKTRCWTQSGANTCLLKNFAHQLSYQNARNGIGYPNITVVNQIVLVEGHAAIIAE